MKQGNMQSSIVSRVMPIKCKRCSQHRLRRFSKSVWAMESSLRTSPVIAASPTKPRTSPPTSRRILLPTCARCRLTIIRSIPSARSRSWSTCRLKILKKQSVNLRVLQKNISSYRSRISITLFPEIKICVRLPPPKEHIFDGQHYWEIGKRRFPTRRIRAVFEKYAVVEQEYVPFENPSHHFFILKKRTP